MTRYSHVCSIAFSIESASKDGGDLQGCDIRAAILRRLHDTPDIELLEAIGQPEDTYEFDS